MKMTKDNIKKFFNRSYKVKLDFCSKLLIAIVFMSVCDAFFTLAWINFGIADEANPILTYSLELGQSYFLLSKISLTVLGCILLYRARKHRFAKKVIVFITSIYFILTVYHLVGAGLSISFEEIKMELSQGFSFLKSLISL